MFLKKSCCMTEYFINFNDVLLSLCIIFVQENLVSRVHSLSNELGLCRGGRNPASRLHWCAGTIRTSWSSMSLQIIWIWRRLRRWRWRARRTCVCVLNFFLPLPLLPRNLQNLRRGTARRRFASCWMTSVSLIYGGRAAWCINTTI